MAFNPISLLRAPKYVCLAKPSLLLSPATYLIFPLGGGHKQHKWNMPSGWTLDFHPPSNFPPHPTPHGLLLQPFSAQ